MAYKSFFDIDTEFLISDNQRSEEASAFEVRLLYLERHKDDTGTLEYSETNEDRPSYAYQIAKIRATKKYIEENRIPIEISNLQLLQLSLGTIIKMVNGINKLMKVFRIGKMSWGGLDITKIGIFLDILFKNLTEYLEMKEEYYELIPTRDIFYQERVDYTLDDVPDDIKSRHRNIGILTTKVLNENRRQTYAYIAGMRQARAYLSTAIAIANEYSSKFREFQEELNERISEISEFREAIEDIRTALIAAGPLIARMASPHSDGKVAVIHSSIISILAEIAAQVDNVMMYFNYYTGVNLDLEEKLRDMRDSDKLFQEVGVIA